MNKRYLVTAALPYSNGRLHVGHIAGAYLPADTYVRFLRSKGENVRFICGSDDNGVTALIAARKEGVSVEELTQFYNERQFQDFERLGIKFDIYGGTHQPDFVDLHNRISQDIFKVIYDKGYFVKKKATQLYDPVAKQFLPDRYVKGSCYHVKSDGTPCNYDEAYGDQCEACGNAIDPMLLINPVSTITGTTPVPRETTHWYLQLDRLENRIREWLGGKRRSAADSPAWREFVLNFSLGQISQGLPERAMTRDLDWGVPVPLDDPEAQGKTLYVWFDAPIGYVSFTAKLCEEQEGDWSRFAEWWKDENCRIVHFVGEDNTIFHVLTWPAMLMAEGTYSLPWQVVVNAFLKIRFSGREEEKISKSRGAAIWIEDYLKTFEPDPLRYYLTAIAPESGRTTFEVNDFIARNNNELLNSLGNFINRTLTFAHRYFDGKVPEAGQRSEIDFRHMTKITEQAEKIEALLGKFQFKAALGELMALARSANVYFDARKPWVQRKENMAECAVTINVCIQTVKALTVLMAPFLPSSAAKCIEMLNLDIDPDIIPWIEIEAEIPAGHQLGQPTVLFKKLDPETLFSVARDV
ncbi:MAG: methionine--tRNA ligase [Candidatus Zixiibacteriota bacterium]|nr:MAG: methionine--tRNA ligase [candidate division Zixibacteria bacterium]